MSRDYLWDSRAIKATEEQGFDKHYEQRKEHYDEIASQLWEILRSNNERPKYLRPDDLYEPLVNILARDSIFEKYCEDNGIPYGNVRNGALWLSYFTHYVVEQCFSDLSKEKEDDKK